MTAAKSLLSLLAVWALGCNVGWAWGKEGHKYVGEIAFSLLDAKTAAKVRACIDGMEPGTAANWMDEIRRDHSYDYMKSWHYVNIEKGQSLRTQKDVPTDPNVINKLFSAMADLADRGSMSHEEIKMDVLVIMHLVGDIHQPLHVGYGADKGANTIKVEFNGRETNLHHLWDSDILNYEKISEDDCLKVLEGMTKAQKAAYSKIDLLEWAKESRAELPNVYAFTGTNIPTTYADANRAVVEKQIALAGLRLAAVLQRLFQN
jgi:S1/P1 Nuclease